VFVSSLYTRSSGHQVRPTDRPHLSDGPYLPSSVFYSVSLWHYYYCSLFLYRSGANYLNQGPNPQYIISKICLTHTHALTLTHARTHTLTLTHSHSHAQTHTRTHTHAHSHTRTHTHTLTHTHTYTHTHSHTHALTLTRALTHTHSRTHTHTHSHTHTYTHTHSHTRALTLTHSHSHTHTLTRTLTHIHKRPNTWNAIGIFGFTVSFRGSVAAACKFIASCYCCTFWLWK
jgi:hypothetical protein